MELAAQKNKIYRELLKTMTPDDVTQEVRDTLKEIRERGYGISLGSSSKNAKFILEQVALKCGKADYILTTFSDLLKILV